MSSDRKAPSLISRSSIKPQFLTSQSSTSVISTNTLSGIASKSTSRQPSPVPFSTQPSRSTSPSRKLPVDKISDDPKPTLLSERGQPSSSYASLATTSQSQITISSQSNQESTVDDQDDENEAVDSDQFSSQSASNALALLRSVSYASQLSGGDLKEKEKATGEGVNDWDEKVIKLDSSISLSRRGRSSSRSKRHASTSNLSATSDSEDSDDSQDPDPFPIPRYYVLTAAGKPVYVSRGADGRNKRKKRNASSKSKSKAKGKERASGEAETQIGEQHEAEGNGYSTSDSEEERSTTRVGVMSALISIYQTDESAPGGGGDKIREIKTSASSSTTSPINLTFLHRPPLHLVCISTSPHTLPYHTILQHLQTLHSYLLSLLTSTQLTSIFSKRSNFDLRRLLGGTDRLLDSLCKKMTLEIGGILGALQPLTLVGSLRDELGTCLRFKSVNGDSKPPPQTLLVLLLEKGKLVTILRPKMTSLHPKDMDILMHTARVATGRSRKCRRSSSKIEGEVEGQEDEDEDSEVWAPICLPKFEHRGFLHMYVSGLKSKRAESKVSTKEKRKVKDGLTSHYKSKLQLIFVTADREAFPALSAWKSDIENSLHSPPPSTPIASLSTSPSLFSLLLKQLPRSTYSVDDLRIAGLRHFVFKSTVHTQITGPRWEGDYGWDGKDDEEGKDLEAWEFNFDQDSEDEDELNLDEMDQEQKTNFFNQKEKKSALRKGRKEKLINRKRLITLYLLANDSIHAPNRSSTPSTNSLFTSLYQYHQQRSETDQSRNCATPSLAPPPFRPPVAGPLKLQYLKTNHEAVLVWLTQSFELYLTLSPWISKSAAVRSANECAKWCSEKESELWIRSSQVF